MKRHIFNRNPKPERQANRTLGKTPLRLIHPIYLDVPMLVSFAAAIQGGLSFNTDISERRTQRKEIKGEAEGKLGLSKWLSKIFQLSMEAGISGQKESDLSQERKESKSHSEASIAILLYDELLQIPGYITHPNDIDALQKVSPGELVEVTGTVLKNAVDTIIDDIEAISILSQLSPKPADNIDYMLKIRKLLDEDRQRTPITSIILKCSQPAGANAIVSLRRNNLRDLTLTELHKNSVRVIGKVTRIINTGEATSTFENYGMALLHPDKLKELFGKISSSQGIVAEFSEVQINGPAVQILPLMLFV